MKISKTFTLIELILVVAIVAILAAAMVPAVTSARMKARVARLLYTVDVLRAACIGYNSDTGMYPEENSNSFLPRHKQLSSRDDAHVGWDGPYIDEPLSSNDNPFGGSIRVHNISSHFDLDGDGAREIVAPAPGNMITFRSIPQEAAQMINDTLDDAIPGNWKDNGTIMYKSGRMQIYLIGGH